MALSGSFSNYPVSSLGLFCEWGAVQSATGNYSTVTLGVYLRYDTIEADSSEGYIEIDGISEHFTTPAFKSNPAWHEIRLASKTVTIDHDGNGRASVSLSASWMFDGTYDGTYIGWIEASTTVELNQIDRSKPTVNITVSDITTSGVTVSATASTMCDAWAYSTDGGYSWTYFSYDAATSASTAITGLSPGTEYTIKVEARKKTNHVYGISDGQLIRTLGNAVLNSVSTLTADDTEAAFTINWTAYSTVFTYDLEIKNGSTTIVTLNIAAQESTGEKSTTLTLTAAQRSTLLSAMASIKSFKGTFSLTTKNGTETIGNVSSKNAIVQTTAANSSPSFSNSAGFTYADSKAETVAITGNDQIMIQNYSMLAVTAYAAVAKNGASITQYQATINGTTVSSNGTSLNCGKIAEYGDIELKVTAIDSRGYSVSVTKSIVVTSYADVDITSVDMRRINGVEAVTRINLAAALSMILVSNENKNAFRGLYYRVKKTSEADYNAFTLIPAESLSVNDTSVEFSSNEFISLDPEFSYHVQFYLLDKLTSEFFTVTIPQGVPLVSKRRRKVGINNRNPKSALDVVGEITQNGVYVLGFVGSIENDFNDYKSGGIYLYSANPTVINAPSSAGLLEVLTAGNGHIIQRFTAFSAGCAMYVRSFIDNTWTAWTQK